MTTSNAPPRCTPPPILGRVDERGAGHSGRGSPTTAEWRISPNKAALARVAQFSTISTGAGFQGYVGHVVGTTPAARPRDPTRGGAQGSARRCVLHDLRRAASVTDDDQRGYDRSVEPSVRASLRALRNVHGHHYSPQHILRSSTGIQAKLVARFAS
jgi:hypothetical protein